MSLVSQNLPRLSRACASHSLKGATICIGWLGQVGLLRFFLENSIPFPSNMFQAPMGRFQVGSELELPLFSGFTVVPFN